MIGASGQITVVSGGSYTLTTTLTIAWRQEYTPGNGYSDIIIDASIVRNASPDGALGGSWWPAAAGSITVNGTAAISWAQNDSNAVWTNPGDTGWSGSGTVRVAHTGSTDVTIAFSGMTWVNYSYSSMNFSLSEKSETVTLNAIPQPNTLTISAGDHANVTVMRNGTALSSGADIYDGDMLTITATADTGYRLGTLTVNGTSISSGSSITVSGDVSIAASAQLVTYSLTVTADTGLTVTVRRTSSPIGGGSIGVLASGATIYYSDVLYITVSASSGYELVSLVCNGSAISSGAYVTVTGNTQITASSNRLGLAYIGGEKYQIYIGNELYAPYIYTANGWQLMN